MKLYLITAEIDVSEDGTKFDRHVIWGGSQADAASARKELLNRGATRKDLKTFEVEVPTNKEGLLQFLNDYGNGDVHTLVATRNLTAK